MEYVYSELWRASYGILKKFGLPSLTHALQVFLLSLAAGDFLTGLLKTLNFAYWRYFHSFNYLLVLGGFLLHYNVGIYFGGHPWINILLFYYCVSHISMYLVDFAWYMGQQYYDIQTQPNKIIGIGTLSIIALSLGAKTVMIYASQLPFILYIGVILAVSLLSRNGRLAQGLIVVIFALVERFLDIYSDENFKLSLVFHIVLLLIALDRQGRIAGVPFFYERQYPASTYFFKAAIWVYIYFVITGQTSHAEYVVGIILLETIIVAGL